MDQIKQQLVDHSPLYSVLVDVITEYLEPCIDYDVPKCNHKIAFCVCGNTFDFRYPLYPYHAREKRILLENFWGFNCNIQYLYLQRMQRAV